MENQFASGSNYVEMIETAYGKTVHKRYESRLKDYEVCWPLGRACVEYKLMQALRPFAQKYFVRLPKIYEFQNSRDLYMEYVEGSPLEESHNVSVRALEGLFLFLYRLSEATDISYPELSDMLSGQKEIVDCMYAWKLSGRVLPVHNLPEQNMLEQNLSVQTQPEQNLRVQNLPVQAEAACLCLGDVSLHNLIYDGERICIVDLECAHMGYPGYDIGQLLGMADAKLAGTHTHDCICRAYETVITDTAYKEQCEHFRTLFIEYYHL